MGMTNALKLSIGELFERIGCNTPAVRDLLGDDGVSEANLMAYLGIIEQRTNEILQVGREEDDGGRGAVLFLRESGLVWVRPTSWPTWASLSSEPTRYCRCGKAPGLITTQQVVYRTQWH